MFWRPNHSMKVNWDVWRDYKETSKVSFVYLECKLQQDKYSLMYIQTQMPQSGTKNIFSNKETTNKVPLMFLNVKVLKQR